MFFEPLVSCFVSLLVLELLDVIQEPLPLRPRILVEKSVALVKHENGFTRPLFSLFFKGFLSRDGFSKSIFGLYLTDRFLLLKSAVLRARVPE